jgi:hypothetical protein
MKKLRLDIDALQVESFDPSGDQAVLRGTVPGAQILAPGTLRLVDCVEPSGEISCRISCMASCIGTCDRSCYRTCGCPSPSADLSACCPIETQYCDTRLCPIENTDYCLNTPAC